MSSTTCTRGTSNSNARGSSEDRRRRREWLVETYRADVDLLRVTLPDGWREGYESFVCEASDWNLEQAEFDHATTERLPACRCYRCGDLLTVATVTVDRIVPGCKGGTYRRDNIRPACGRCNSETGGVLASHPKRRKNAP